MDHSGSEVKSNSVDLEREIEMIWKEENQQVDVIKSAFDVVLDELGCSWTSTYHFPSFSCDWRWQSTKLTTCLFDWAARNKVPKCWRCDGGGLSWKRESTRQSKVAKQSH